MGRFILTVSFHIEPLSVAFLYLVLPKNSVDLWLQDF
jgi:hypothetical protein